VARAALEAQQVSRGPSAFEASAACGARPVFRRGDHAADGGRVTASTLPRPGTRRKEVLKHPDLLRECRL
jgi:hypothetical protein